MHVNGARAHVGEGPQLASSMCLVPDAHLHSLGPCRTHPSSRRFDLNSSALYQQPASAGSIPPAPPLFVPCLHAPAGYGSTAAYSAASAYSAAYNTAARGPAPGGSGMSASGVDLAYQRGYAGYAGGGGFAAGAAAGAGGAGAGAYAGGAGGLYGAGGARVYPTTQYAAAAYATSPYVASTHPAATYAQRPGNMQGIPTGAGGSLPAAATGVPSYGTTDGRC